MEHPSDADSTSDAIDDAAEHRRGPEHDPHPEVHGDVNADGTLAHTADSADLAGLHPNAANVARALAGLGVAGQVRELDDRAATAVAAAELLGIEVGAVANSLVFDADGEPLLVMTSGAHRADTTKLASIVDANRVRRADADFVRAATGQPIGGVAPVGHPKPLRTVVDVDLARYDVVWAAGGHPHYVFPTTYDELLRITAGEAAEVGE
ncbi:MAG: YbaK/EbsC family protein [Candidatus Nanopelagicales bacterium]